MFISIDGLYSIQNGKFNKFLDGKLISVEIGQDNYIISNCENKKYKIYLTTPSTGIAPTKNKNLVNVIEIE